MTIFDASKAIGFFVGLTEGGLQFGAELTLRYSRDYQRLPMLGQFIVVELERPDEAVLGRITAIGSHGRLASSAGEDVSANAVENKRPMPEDIRQQFLRYKCAVRLLGLLRERLDGTIIFTPSHRRLPHMGAQVTFAEGNVLKAVAGNQRPGDPIGYLAFGEFIYAQGAGRIPIFDDAFQILAPEVTPNFDANGMVSRRTCVFARAGFGKSNLLKTLFSRLYERTIPTVDRRGTPVPVGTLVFDPDGEYFWPGVGVTAPPGLCDVPALRDRIILITDRTHPQPYYQSFVVARPRFDLRSLRPSLLLPCVLEGDRINQRGTEALMRMDMTSWGLLVDLTWAYLQGLTANISDAVITRLCRVSGSSAETVAGGIRNTMLNIVQMLHDPTSYLLENVQQGLRDGKLVVVDLSLMRGRPATALSSVLLRWLFEFNVEENTKPNSAAIPIIALIEEAQKVLQGSSIANAPFIEWVKEGRKYDLGAVLVTQQPGAIDQEIVSQADNMFVFHLLSDTDLRALKTANGHFSEDILASLLNEPIEGQGVFYTSTAPKLTYPIPFRAYNFGDIYQRLSAAVTQTDPPTYAKGIRDSRAPKDSTPLTALPGDPVDQRAYPNKGEITKPMRDLATEIQADLRVGPELRRNEFPKFLVEGWLRNSKGRKRDISKLADGILTCIFGLYGYGWVEEEATSRNGKTYQKVRVLDKADGLNRLNNDEDPLVEGTSSTDDDLADIDAEADDNNSDDESDDIPF